MVSHNVNLNYTALGCPCKKNGGGSGKKVTIVQPKSVPQPNNNPTSPSSPLRPASK